MRWIGALARYSANARRAEAEIRLVRRTGSADGRSDQNHVADVAGCDGSKRRSPGETAIHLRAEPLPENSGVQNPPKGVRWLLSHKPNQRCESNLKAFEFV